MNTNKEAIYNLVSLLVKKSGFNMNDNRAQDELYKIKESMDKLKREQERSSDNSSFQNLIDNLKIRQDFWKNNAQMIGKELVDAYSEGKNLEDVKEKIDMLFNKAIEGTLDLQVSFIYSRINKLEDEMKSLKNKIDTNDYINDDEKEMDKKYQLYLENKIKNIDTEIDNTLNEIKNFEEIEEKDTAIINKINEYNDGLSCNLKVLDDISEENINSEITFDVWERLEMTRSTIEEKLDRSKDLLLKTENKLEKIKDNINHLNETIGLLEEDKKKCNNKLKNVNNKLEKNDYINITQKMLDISSYEMIKIEIESLKNKKDVIYVDADKVKQELQREWNNLTNEKYENPKELINKKIVKIEKIIKEEPKAVIDEESIPVEENEKVIEIPKKENEEVKNNKYELDW